MRVAKGQDHAVVVAAGRQVDPYLAPLTVSRTPGGQGSVLDALLIFIDEK